MTACSANTTLLESLRSTLSPDEAYDYLPRLQDKP